MVIGGTDKMDKSYVTFLLISDDFAVSEILRNLKKNGYAMDELFEITKYIADKFMEYDSCREDTSMYDNLETFLELYYPEIRNWIHKSERFNVEVTNE